MRIIALILAVTSVFTAFGSNSVDSVKVYFRASYRIFEPQFGENRKTFAEFSELVRKSAESGNIERIIVRGSASPDGLYDSNMILAANRRTTLADLIEKNTGVSRDLIELGSAEIGWDELRTLVAGSSEVPWRDEVLEILDKPPLDTTDSTGKVSDCRKKRLMDLRGGESYRWLLKNMFPELRNAVAVMLFTRNPEDPGVSHDEIAETAPASESDKDVALAVEEVIEEVVTGKTPEVASDERIRKEKVALKTNLLYDAALLPNLELEWMFARKWSASLEGDVAWYKKDMKAYRLAMVSPEVRYWVKEKKPWHGMYVGVFAGGGLYELSNGRKAYEGEGVMAGLSLGYMWPIYKSLSLEAGIGAGYMFTQYKECNVRDGHYVYQRTKNLNYWGPLKLKLALVWRIGYYEKPKTNKSAK